MTTLGAGADNKCWRNFAHDLGDRFAPRFWPKIGERRVMRLVNGRRAILCDQLT